MIVFLVCYIAISVTLVVEGFLNPNDIVAYNLKRKEYIAQIVPLVALFGPIVIMDMLIRERDRVMSWSANRELRKERQQSDKELYGC